MPPIEREIGLFHHAYSPCVYSGKEEPPFAVSENPQLAEPEAKYSTGFGNLTFSELYTATHRIARFTFQQKVGMTNSEDIDDCMQVGYLKVWKQLQKIPSLFEGKPKTYVVQAIVLYSKSQRYAHMRHNRKIIYNPRVQPHSTSSSLTILQIETWIDLAKAIQRVAEHVTALDNSIYLLALYTLITEVKTQDVAKLSHIGLSTLTKAKRQVRATLAKELPQYGDADDSVPSLSLVDS